MTEIGYEISFSITVKKLLAKVRNIFWMELFKTHFDKVLLHAFFIYFYNLKAKNL